VSTDASAFVLHLSTREEVEVAASDGSVHPPCFGSRCDIAFIAGVTVTLNVPFTTDEVNCLTFDGWTGACAGQGNPCKLVMNSDLTTATVWKRLLGCSPP